MREEYQPGDLSVRIGFGRVMGNGPDAGTVKPTIEITDQTSGNSLQIEITAKDFTDLMSGGGVEVPRDRVSGFKGLSRWGRYLKIRHKVVPSGSGDYLVKTDPLELPHVADAVAEIEADGFTCDKPSLSHGNWRVVGRRYDETP